MVSDARTALALGVAGAVAAAVVVWRIQGRDRGGAAPDTASPPSGLDTTPAGGFFVPNYLNTPTLEGFVPMYSARGLRNNNPGNIRWQVANDWQGQTGSDDQGYAIFVNMHSGIRALVRVLDNYRKQGLITVRAIISKWAPLGDNNNTGAYIDAVCGQLDVFADQIIDTSNAGIMSALVHAITYHENGSDPLDNGLIAEAINDARA